MSTSCMYCGHDFAEHTLGGCAWISPPRQLRTRSKPCSCKHMFGGDPARIVDLLHPRNQFVRMDPFTLEEVAELRGGWVDPEVLIHHEALRDETGNL